ncbi:O-antigen ligase family protein [Novosphingobium ginsenosidimutans]|uniref:O-antigen ligase family protein n=1 Tax=Novosphingobium ginsenosidimutans TaxID=1176536 RepID=A0A5B8S4R6_9SPHN|nr:O-antigen ligase family protein [Novosphingobium ginsenosidimutans]QEA16108.1 O-antigen ligase family protein [Novosphingobium ginsenosidimutans]
MNHSGAFSHDRALTWLAFVYVLAQLTLGGGGTPAPLMELACQLLAAVALICWVALRGPDHLRDSTPLWWVIGLVAIVPALQLIPLPPALWQALPGRDLLRESLALVGAEQSWWPLSVAPQRTLDGLLALLPPLLALAMAASLSSDGRQLLLKAIAGFALLSVAVGAAQLASAGKGALAFYVGSDPGVLGGFQANRNAQVDVLLIGLTALIGAWYEQAGRSRAMLATVGALALVLLLGAFLTGSRTGIALIPFALAWCLFLVRAELSSQTSLFRLRNLALAGAIGMGLAAAAWQTRPVQQVLLRFGFNGEYRPDIWRDTLFAIEQYWPIGSGVGTFTRVIGPAERLEAIGPVLPNRAHSEYLELLLEGGLPLALAWAAAAALVALALARALRAAGGAARAQAAFSAGTLTVVSLHSLVDYPFRSMALASLVGVAAAFVLVPPARSGNLRS